MERWTIDLAMAQKLKVCMLRAKEHKNEKIRSTASKKLKRAIGTLAYDLMIHGEVAWTHDVITITSNVVEALLLEQQEIANDVHAGVSYNRTRGGELPKYVPIDVILCALREFDAQTRESLFEICKTPPLTQSLKCACAAPARALREGPGARTPSASTIVQATKCACATGASLKIVCLERAGR